MQHSNTQRTFDPWQQEAIEISGGRHLVLAPPGCGKTDILTERVVHAHEEGVEYSDMLCLTFTNRAAKGMALRIAERTGNPVPDNLYVGNIHRFCSQLLFNQGLVNHNSAIIDESDVENIIQEELCKKMRIQSRTTELMRYQHALWQTTLGHTSNIILHNELLHLGSIHKLCDILGMPSGEESIAYIYQHIDELHERYPTLSDVPALHTLRLAKAYQQYKENNDLLDYDDLLILAYQHLARQGKDTSASAPLHRYGWIEIDEVQDLNNLQFALIDLLATEDATIVYLGDEQQAIFSFIGAKLETLEALKRRCGHNIHHLHTNYRSPNYLLQLQNDYAVQNLGISREYLPSNSNSAECKSEDLCLIDVGDATLEAYYTARFAKRYGDREPDGRVAILVSTNREADEISDTMQAMNVPHFKISGTDLFSLPSIRLLLAHLSVLCDETVFIAWARILWGVGITPTYTAARNLMREMRRISMLPNDFLVYNNSSYIQEFVRAYNSEELVIFDTETTGLDPVTDDIIQIAAIKVRQGRIVGKPFNIILETERELPETVGGHPNPMIEVYRTSKRHSRAEGLQRFMDYCAGKILVGHNVEYDYQILSHNLQRSYPAIKLDEVCPTYFDTLKYIRLIRPRLRHYKLVHLIEALHLEGENTHRADDDIMATLSLLQFCHISAMQMIASQQLFMSNNRGLIDKFRTRYGELYRTSQTMLRHPSSGASLSDLLQQSYNILLSSGLIGPVEKWGHLIHYIEADLVRPDLYPTLRMQLERYTTDLCTTKEADLCGNSLQERFIISTVHKAKGLEFDTVIVYRCIDGNYPSQRSWTEKQMAEDARRLFVAISRARKHLMIVTDSYYGRTPHALSPFLDKLRHHFTLFYRTPDGKIREG